jgi:hypothetical protein
MDEHELGAEPDRALEELRERRDAACDRRHLVRADTWSPAGANSGKRSISSSASA